MQSQATIVVDLGFGDAGKGTIVDYVARSGRKATVVRFNGGAQAAHNVHTTDGRHHTFAQFGSGSFVPGVRAHLSRFMLVDVPALFTEAEHLKEVGVEVLGRLSIDRAARIVTPFHIAANRIREVLRGSGKHGSCGRGIGETMADAIAFPHRTVYAADLRSPETLVEKFRFFQKLKFDEFKTVLADVAHDAKLADDVRLLEASDAPEVCAMTYWKMGIRLRIVDGAYLRRLGLEGDLIFEGAQGVLLDEWHGFHPYTTWSTTTTVNALTLLSEIGYRGQIEKIGVVRAYGTRHGVGPFPTEVRGMSLMLPDTHNVFGRWQDGFRVGWFDAVLTRYAISVCGGIDSIALTHLDRIARVPHTKLCTAYDLAHPTRIEERAIVGSVHSAAARITSLVQKSLLTDLRYQEVLTGILERATPLYVNLSGGDRVEDVIERELGVPISITSHGTTAAHKKRRAHLLKVA